MPVAELTFVKVLAGLQSTFILLAYLGAKYFVEPESVEHGSWKEGFGDWHMLLAFAPNSSISMFKEPPGAGDPVLRELTDICHRETKYSSANSASQRTPNELNDAKFNMVFWPSLVAMALVVLGIFCCVPFSRRWLVSCRRLALRPQKLEGCILLLPALFLMSSTCFLSLVILEWHRLSLQQVTGEANKESEWGFGQVLAVLLWLPLVEEFFVVVWGKYSQFSCVGRSLTSSCRLIFVARCVGCLGAKATQD
jgi:hypothetical protein